MDKKEIAERKKNVAIKILDEIIEQFVRSDIDITYFDRKIKVIAHSKPERKEAMQSQMQAQHNKETRKILIQSIAEKIAEYDKESKPN